MYSTAKFVKEIVVTDPDTKGEVHLAVYKHENGGMFAIDSSYVDQILADVANDSEDEMTIFDPFTLYTENKATLLTLQD